MVIAAIIGHFNRSAGGGAAMKSFPGFLLTVVVAAAPAQAGHMYLEWLDCSPQYKLWAVSWEGPWSASIRHLDIATTNAGPWTRVDSYIPESACRFPATNQRWYRVSAPGGLFCCTTLASIWVPRHYCGGGGDGALP